MRLPRIPQYRAERYVEGFEDQAQELFSRCFGGRVFDRAVWNWQFIDNPCLNKRITTLWDNEVLVAMTALTPSYAMVDGKRVKCAISGTTMARDDYRGVSIQLVQESGNQNTDIEFKYSFPNKQAFRIATQFYEHHYVGDIAFWTIKPFFTEIDKYRILKIDSFDKKHGELYKSIANDHSFVKCRDFEYLNWRFVNKPHSGYELYHLCNNDFLHGYIVVNEYLEGEEKHFQIIDIIADSFDAFSQLIKFAIKLAYERQSDIVKLWLTSYAYKDVLTNIGFEYGMQPFRMTVWDRDIDIEKSYITMADSDVF